MVIKGIIFTFMVLSAFVSSNTVQADPVAIAAYKHAFPDTHLKCSDCHSVFLPMKAEGRHPWNAYGRAVKKAINAAGIPDVPASDDIDKIAGIFKQIGKIEDFKDSTAKQ